MRERDRLLVAMGKACDRASRADVILAACDLILNVIRQQHGSLRDGQIELAEIARYLNADLPTHYDAAGRRKETRIVLPTMKELMAGSLN